MEPLLFSEVLKNLSVQQLLQVRAEVNLLILKKSSLRENHSPLIANSKISGRLKNILSDAGLQKWSELEKFSLADLKKFRNAGAVTINEIVTNMEQRNLKLKP